MTPSPVCVGMSKATPSTRVRMHQQCIELASSKHDGSMGTSHQEESGSQAEFVQSGALTLVHEVFAALAPVVVGRLTTAAMSERHRSHTAVIGPDVLHVDDSRFSRNVEV